MNIKGGSSLTIEIIPCSKLRIDFIPKKQKFDLETKKEINKHWQKSKDCFNGSLINVIQFENNEDVSYFLTQIGSYKDFIGTKNKRPNSLNNVSKGNYCMPLSIGSITISNDNKIVVSKRKGTFLNNNCYSFPAEGYLDLRCITNNNVSIFNGLALEMNEELGINELRAFHILGIVYDSLITKQPYIATIWKTSLNSTEIEERFYYAEKKEFQSIEFIENEKDCFIEFINGHELTLHNLGKAMLYILHKGW